MISILKYLHLFILNGWEALMKKKTKNDFL